MFKAKDLAPRLYKSGGLIYKTCSAIGKTLDCGRKVTKKSILTGLVAGMCYGSSWAQSSDEPDYFPLQVGNRWVYEYLRLKVYF